MDRINRINEAGTAYLIAETDLNSIRLMGAVGRKYRETGGGISPGQSCFRFQGERLYVG